MRLFVFVNWKSIHNIYLQKPFWNYRRLNAEDYNLSVNANNAFLLFFELFIIFSCLFNKDQFTKDLNNLSNYYDELSIERKMKYGLNIIEQTTFFLKNNSKTNKFLNHQSITYNTILNNALKMQQYNNFVTAGNFITKVSSTIRYPKSPKIRWKNFQLAGK